MPTNPPTVSQHPSGQAVDTLPDRPCRPGGVLLVGINPSPVSVEAGHYYQGTLGKRLWVRLEQAGLLAASPGEWEDDVFVEAGNGLTDLVKRPTARATGLEPEELAAGRSVLAAKVRDWQPGLLLFAYKPPAEALLGSGVSAGACGDFEGIPSFLLASPYAKREISEANLSELRTVLGEPQSVDLKRDAEAPPRPAAPAAGPVGYPTQRVTAVDLEKGRIRLPAQSVSGAKGLFPSSKRDVQVVIRGTRVSARYDPRLGADRERSGVLNIGRGVLQRLVRAGERLQVIVGDDGMLRLD